MVGSLHPAEIPCGLNGLLKQHFYLWHMRREAEMVADGVRRLIRDHRGALRLVAALATLTIFIALIGAGLFTNMNTTSSPVADGSGDVALYNRIIEHVRGGESYYTAAIRELRNGNYPVRPFVAVRPPAHAMAMAALPDETMRRLLLTGLAIITLAAWAWHWRGRDIAPAHYAFALIILATGVGPAFVPNAYPLHEVWAGLLIALSLAVRRPDAWLASVLVGTGAALLRELAAPYLLAMAVVALAEGHRKEAAAWFAGIAVFAAVLAVHAFKVGALVTAADPVSPSWLQIGGWHFVLQTAQWNLLLQIAPNWLGAILVPLALLGLTASRGPLGRRLALIVAGYIAAFVFVGRDNNSYWGLIIAPLWPLGLLTAWPALVRCAADTRAFLLRDGSAFGTPPASGHETPKR